ncbi:MAG: hypothetical protein R2852_06905 [Bacteroidia bacterium]
MNKKLYYILITIAFGIISIPTVLSIVVQEIILTDYIDRNFLKTVLIFFICFVEASYMKRTYPKLIGWVFSIVLLVGILFKIMLWPWSSEMIIFSGVVILINLTTAAIIEKKKEILPYLLYSFILQRLLIILIPANELLWWIDVIICFAVTLVGIGTVSKFIPKK